MTLLMRDQENIEKGIQLGIEQGIEQGEKRLAKLTQVLLKEKRYDALGQISEDEEYRKKLYEEYKICQ